MSVCILTKDWFDFVKFCNKFPTKFRQTTLILFIQIYVSTLEQSEEEYGPWYRLIKVQHYQYVPGTSYLPLIPWYMFNVRCIMAITVATKHFSGHWELLILCIPHSFFNIA